MVTGRGILLNMAVPRCAMSDHPLPSGYVGSTVHEHPFDTLASNPTRIVLDEFERRMSVQRLFLSALDTGEIQMANGPAVDMSRCIVIAA